MCADQSQTLSQIIEQITGDRIHEKKGDFIREVVELNAAKRNIV